MRRRESTSEASIYRKVDYASHYDTDRFGRRFGRHLEDREVETFCGLLDSSCRRVLDAGCGSGKLTIPLLAAGREATGADSSIEMLNVARQKAVVTGSTPMLVVADLQALSFSDSAFDCTVSSRVLMHLRDWRAGIAEICRVTGHLIVIDFPPRISFAGLDAFLKRRPGRRHTGPRQPYRTFLLNDVVHELEVHGFTVTQVVRTYFVPVLLHRRLNMPALSEKIERLLSKIGLVRALGAPVTLKAVRQRSQANPRVEL